MDELEEQKEEKIEPQLQEEIQKEDELSQQEDNEKIDNEIDNENVSKDFLNVIKSRFNDYNINIIMGDYVRQNRGVITGENAIFRNTDFYEKEKQYENKEQSNFHDEADGDFKDEDGICNWMKKNFGKEPFLWLISLSVFHDMPYHWVKTNAGLLESRKVFDIGNEDDEKEILTTSDLLKKLDVITYKRTMNEKGAEIEADFVRFAKEDIAEKVLKSIWEQFQNYRDRFFDWLKLFAYQTEIEQAYAAMEAISYIAQLDFYYFKTHLIQGMLLDNNIFVLTEILSLISKNEKYIAYIDNEAKHWGTLKKCKCVLAALSVAQKNGWSVSEIKPVMSQYFDGTVSAMKKTWLEEYLQNFPTMFVIGQREANYYYAMIEVMFYLVDDGLNKSNSPQSKSIEQIFLMMVETDLEYTKVIRKNREMILVNITFVKNRYAAMLTELWRRMWRKYGVHIQLRNIMVAYWKEKYNRDIRYEMQMRQFFYKIGVSEREQQIIYREVLEKKNNEYNR